MNKENGRMKGLAIVLMALMLVAPLSGCFEQPHYQYKHINLYDYPWIKTPYGTYFIESNTTAPPTKEFADKNIYQFMLLEKVYNPSDSGWIFYPNFRWETTEITIPGKKVTLHNDSNFHIVLKYLDDSIVHADIYMPVHQLYGIGQEVEQK